MKWDGRWNSLRERDRLAKTLGVVGRCIMRVHKNDWQQLKSFYVQRNRPTSEQRSAYRARLLLNIQALFLSQECAAGKTIHMRECFVSTLQLLKGEMGLFPCLQGNPAILLQSVITTLHRKMDGARFARCLRADY